MNSEGASERGKIEQPIGTVLEKRRDGTVLIQLNMDNQVCLKIIAAGLIGGSAAANDVLKRAQAADKN